MEKRWGVVYDPNTIGETQGYIKTFHTRQVAEERYEKDKFEAQDMTIYLVRIVERAVLAPEKQTIKAEGPEPFCKTCGWVERAHGPDGLSEEERPTLTDVFNPPCDEFKIEVKS